MKPYGNIKRLEGEENGDRAITCNSVYTIAT